MIRTTVFTKLSREVRPDDDLSAENLQDVDGGGIVEMELLNGDKGTAEVNSSDSFVERLKGTTFTKSIDPGVTISGIQGCARARLLTLTTPARHAHERHYDQDQSDIAEPKFPFLNFLHGGRH